ncbi:MAG: NAD-dependent malic enzyme, partial [Lapillicoccus sp.]
LDIPVFHDDQHGTAIVTLAALTNAARVIDRSLDSLRVVVSGAGAAGVAVTKILLAAGVVDIVVVDSQGTLHAGRDGLPVHKAELAALTNPRQVAGGLHEALLRADVFVGVSGGTVPETALAGMSADAVIMALANPDPEVHPDVAHRYARVVATGRSDFPNQINNVLAFPGIFRGALDSGATIISEEMKLAAARAIAGLVEHPTADLIVPSVFDPRVAPAVAAAVSRSV